MTHSPGSKSRSALRRWAAGALALLGGALVFASFLRQAEAHIVPPRAYHPAARAYLRLEFFLNLNPVPWPEVREDCRLLADQLRSHGAGDADAAAALAMMQHALNEAARLTVAGEPHSQPELRRGCLTGAMRGVAWLLRDALRHAVASVDDYSLARQDYDRAYQIFEAFNETIGACDPRGHARLGAAWLECSNSLGHPGLAGVGVVEPDRELLATQSAVIHGYIEGSFQRAEVAQRGDRYVAVPQGSSSYVAGSEPPLRLPPGADLSKQQPRPRQILNMATRGVDERDTYLIALGDMVFDSSYIFGEPARSLGISCNTCHNKGTTNPLFVIPGLSTQPNGMDVSGSFFNKLANNGHRDFLDTPDLRGIRFTAPYGRNGRFGSLRDFVRNVIVNEFAGAEPDPEIVDGLVAYMLEFDFLPNESLNRNGTLNSRASTSARRGERIFNTQFAALDGKSCASCHVPSAHFRDGRAHDIGSGSPSQAHIADTAFDTPTLLNAKYSPPYFHDGSLPTLRSVNEWFNNKYRLGLTAAQLDDLTAYVETVGDGVDPYEPPGSVLAPELEEFSIFMSALRYAIPARKRAVVETTGRTIAFELQAHKWDVQDPSLLPVLDELAEHADAVADAAIAGDWDAAMRAYHAYNTLYEEHAEELQ